MGREVRATGREGGGGREGEGRGRRGGKYCFSTHIALSD